MNLVEEAIIYAATMHAGAFRKGTQTPYILHSTEVAQIISTMTDDQEVIAAGVLHDVVEDTDGTLGEIEERFGKRIAVLVSSDTETKVQGKTKSSTWKARKEESLIKLRNTKEIEARMLWLGDKLSNIRSIHRQYTEMGAEVWNLFHQKDPQMHRWYYQTIAEILEIDLNQTGAFKEFVLRINAIWPDTFSDYKTKYKKYRRITLDNQQILGRGAKSTVYRYDDELILKVYENEEMFKNIEQEIQIARKALIAGIPTAIPFGIVMIEDKYGSLFELIASDSMSNMIEKDPSRVEEYAKAMAEIALQIHHTDGSEMDLPDYMQEVYRWVEKGIAHVDKELAQRVNELLDTIPPVTTLIHGDFHTGNVMKQGEEFLLIDMGRLCVCHPIIELSEIYMFYVGFGELDPSVVESFMGFSYDTANQYFDSFLKYYLNTEDEEKLQSVRNMAALLSYVNLIKKCFKKGLYLKDADQRKCDYYVEKIRELLDQWDPEVCGWEVQ